MVNSTVVHRGMVHSMVGLWSHMCLVERLSIPVLTTSMEGTSMVGTTSIVGFRSHKCLV